MTALIDIDTLNALDADGFVAALDGIFEHTDWVAAQTAQRRPFATRFDLADALADTLHTADRERQLALVRAHPDLAGRTAARGELTAASSREQAGAGLDQCSAPEFARLQALNEAYRQRFGFPFVLAVKGHDRASILAAFERRLHQDADTELATAVAEIARIARFRLAERVTAPPGSSILAMAERLARLSEQPDALTCTFMTPVHRATAALLREWMLEAGLDAHIDAIGNVVGRWRSARPGAKTLLTGSHYDTVIDAGRYDGRLGILLPIVAVQQLRLAGVALPFAVEIIGFSDEEGVRFQTAFLGSSAVAGSFDAGHLDRRDAAGISLRDALITAGNDPDAIPALVRDATQLLGYLEVHIEQGPVLLTEDRALGVVSAINGCVRHRVVISGEAGHAGTVPMNLRHDAAAAAAEIVLLVEQRCAQVPGLVGTVGQLGVPNGAVNVIPGVCELSLDIRAPSDAVRDAAAADILAGSARIAARRGVTLRIEPLLTVAAMPCAANLQEQIAASIGRVTGSADVRHLPSGAGHDAMQIAGLTEVGMLFVRCGHGGISHHPAETLSAADAELATAAFMDFLQQFPLPDAADNQARSDR